MSDRDDVNEIKLTLNDPTRALEGLGLMGQGKERQRQANGWMVRCFVHTDGSPSCSVQQKDGVILWKCWACQATGDILDMVAAANHLDIKTDFKAVLAAAARLGGLWHLVDKLEGRAPRESRPAPAPLPPVAPEPPREWPDKTDVDAFWSACTTTEESADVVAYLRARSLSPELVDARELARALPEQGALPVWARYRGGNPVSRTWRELGYKLIFPMYDASGDLRSVRAGRVVDGDGPKRLPPGRHKASELVMADAFGRAMLRGEFKPYRLTIVEGEPDFLTRAIVMNDPHGATIGIVSGSWTKAFAERVPLGCRVYLRTDVDDAGNRYAQEIEATLRRRAFLWRRQA
jgi:hypothetical protein